MSHWIDGRRTRIERVGSNDFYIITFIDDLQLMMCAQAHKKWFSFFTSRFYRYHEKTLSKESSQCLIRPPQKSNLKSGLYGVIIAIYRQFFQARGNTTEQLGEKWQSLPDTRLSRNGLSSSWNICTPSISCTFCNLCMMHVYIFYVYYTVWHNLKHRQKSNKKEFCEVSVLRTKSYQRSNMLPESYTFYDFLRFVSNIICKA